MKRRLVAVVGVFLCLPWAAFPAGAQEDPPATSDSQPSDQELLKIRQTSQDFVRAFDAGDAAAVAAHWTEDGDFVDEAGRVVVGREEIQREYEAFFAAHPGVKMRLMIDSLRLLNDDSAVEDGHIILEPLPVGPPVMSKYVAVHVKSNGHWLMSTVRDTRIEMPSAYHSLQGLEWMIGSWSAEEHGLRTEVTCRWVANKSFIQRDYRVSHAGHVASSGVQIIGLNPQGGHVQSWTFASDGGHAVGVWTPRDGGWMIESQGMLLDGTPTSAVTWLTPLGEEAFAWQSVSRKVAGMTLPDTDEIVLKRTPAGD